MLAVGVLVSTGLVSLATSGCERLPRTEETVADEVAVSDETSATGDARTLLEVLGEYDRHVPNYAEALVNPGINYVPYAKSFYAELAADEREYEALMASFSPGVRARFEGKAAERIAAWEEEKGRREAEEERDEREYAAFIEEHLRRLYDGNEGTDD